MQLRDITWRKKKEKSHFHFPFHSNMECLFLSGQSPKYTTTCHPVVLLSPSYPFFSLSQYSHLPCLTFPDNSSLLYSHPVLKSYPLYHKIRHLIIYCLVLFSNCVMGIFSFMLNCEFSRKDQFLCFYVSPSAFKKHEHIVAIQRILNWPNDFSRFFIILYLHSIKNREKKTKENYEFSWVVKLFSTPGFWKEVTEMPSWQSRQ